MQVLKIQTKNTIFILEEWPEYLRDGKQFLQTAANAHAKKKKSFNNEALYNLVCMGIEKYIMAVLMKHGDLAENHTMIDLVHALERHTGNLEIREKLLYLDSFQEICSLENAHYQEPNNKEIKDIIEIGLQVQKLLSPLLEGDANE